ncbi:MAG: hypothetical protein IT355_01360 [Gemmatimonadaceae bacterium]|nr:hypothetical protein [Gemmatimonadaceae bacterium]
MIRAHLACLATAVLLAAGCTPPRVAPAAMPADTIAAIALERGACHGTCPIYVLQLFEDGRAVFNGERFVRVMGTDSAHVSRDAVAGLQRQFRERGFTTLPGVIARGTPRCGPYATDLPTVQLTVRQADATHRVRFDGGCMDHPLWLDSLAAMVDSVAGASRWITR